MRAAVRVRLSAGARDRGVLGPLAALALVLLGIFAYRPNDVHPTWALTALLAFPLAAWGTLAVLRSLPEPHREMAVAAGGGMRAADRATLAVAGLGAAGIGAAFLLYPLLIGAFAPAATPRDVADAAAAHLACGLLGAQLGRTLAPPIVTRPANAAVIVLAAFLLTVAAASVAGVAAGPMAVSDAVAADEPGDLYPAAAGCLAWAAAAEAVRRRLVRWIG